MRRIAFAVALAASGCAGQYYAWHPTKQYDEYMEERAECYRLAALEYPVNIQQVVVEEAHSAPRTFRCMASTGAFGIAGGHCAAGGGEYVPARKAVMDVNREPREQYPRACLEAMGWRPVWFNGRQPYAPVSCDRGTGLCNY